MGHRYYRDNQDGTTDVPESTGTQNVYYLVINYIFRIKQDLSCKVLSRTSGNTPQQASATTPHHFIRPPVRGGYWSQFDAWRRSLCKKAQLSLQILRMADREADKMALWQHSHKEASSHARGRDGGKDKQMLFITQGWWGFSSA